MGGLLRKCRPIFSDPTTIETSDATRLSPDRLTTDAVVRSVPPPSEEPNLENRVRVSFRQVDTG